MSVKNIAAVISGIISNKYDIYMMNFTMIDGSDLLKRFENLIQKNEVIKIYMDLLSKVGNESRKYKILIDKLAKAMAAFNTFASSVSTTQDGEKRPLIVSALMQDHIRQTGITHLLYLNITSSGGEAITERRIFSSGNTAYIGGSIVSYILAQSDGKIISADTHVAFSELDYKFNSGKSLKLRDIELER